MKKSRRTYNGVHLNKKSNTQDVVEQSLTLLMGLLFAPIISVFARMFCIIKGLYLYILLIRECII